MSVTTQFKHHLMAANCTPATVQLRLAHVRRVTTAIGMPIDAIGVGEVTEFFATQSWAPATRRSYRASIVKFFRFAHRIGAASWDGEGLPATPAPRSVPRPADDAMIRAALARAGERETVMIELMAYGGLRRGEVSRVRGEDVTGQWLHVVGKGGHSRVVPLPRHLASRIQRTRGWLFPGQIDGHLSARRVGELVGELLPRGVTAHALRHRFATRVYAQSGDIRAVQTLLGHAKLDTTMIYVGVHDNQRLAAASTAWTMTA
ncbi:tyrosine-type recombinase/integrase [Corynebacterium auriscanis]|uniref:tyrosine-type recombinase/integrase n=1 Tax=Corynebacterium auriscanis TaxID=99807 RepID=UPI0024AE3AEC|nr:tyrosine-type recombinase/integrase [Corynebacterium auriscanis]